MSSDSSEKLYYTIGEVSRMLNLSSSLIRFWEKEFTVIKPHKNKKGNRFFTKADIELLKLIHSLVKEQGFTLEGARQKMKLDKKQKTPPPVDLIKKLENARSMLLELKDSF